MKNHVLILSLLIFVFCCESKDVNLTRAEKAFALGNLEAAIENIDKIDSLSPDYKEGILLKGKIKIIQEADSVQAEKDKTAEKQKRIDDLKSAIESIEKNPLLNGKNTWGSVSEIFQDVDFFDISPGFLLSAEIFQDQPDLIKYSKSVHQKFKKAQLEAFPKMRKAYGKFSGSELWEHNVDVKVTGSRSTTIEYQAVIFANNKNIKDFQSKMSDPLKSLRFKRAQYRIFKNDSESVYYTLETLKDSD